LVRSEGAANWAPFFDAFVYVFRHLKRIERTIAADNLVRTERGPRNNLVLIICAVPVIVTTLLLFLILKA